MSGSGRKALLDDRVWSGDPSECPKGSYGYPGVVGWPSRMSGSGQESLPVVWEWSEALPNIREW